MTKRTNPMEKRARKRVQLCERIARLVDCSLPEAEQLLSIPLVQSVRLNPLADSGASILVKMQGLGWSGRVVDWCENGYSTTKGYQLLRDSSLAEDGLIYIQNQSSWLPVIALDPKPGEKILDICAAPGGKTSHIAAITGNRADIIANDNSRPRLLRLQRNMERLHASAGYTLYDARRLVGNLIPQQFDKILLDAPCSGEGLINLDNPRSLDSWSVAHIKRLASLQKQIISQAWLLLKPGGTLAYSTCTMAPEENEAVIDYLLRKHNNVQTIPITVPSSELQPAATKWNERVFHSGVNNARRVFPRHGNEAFFVCLIMKQNETIFS